VLGSWALHALLPLFAGTLPQTVTVAVDGASPSSPPRLRERSASSSAPWSRRSGRAIGLSESLKTSGRTTTARRATRVRTTLVVAQVALAVVLLSAAGLMLNSVMKLSRVGTGFAADHVLTTRIALSGSNYAPAAAASPSPRSCWRACARRPA
jgi:hypothetical protein